MSAKILFRSSALFISLVILGVVMKTTGLGIFFDETWIDKFVRGQGTPGILLFVGVGWGLTSVGLPRQLVAFLGGYAFGFVIGTGLALAATTLGCVTAFMFARLLGRELVARKISERIKRIDDFLSDNPFSMTLLIRLLPLGSNFLTNLAAGVSGVSPWPFFAGSALGYIPQMVVFALVGSGIALDPGLRISLSAVLFVVSGLIGISLYRKYRHGKTFDEALEEDPAR
ncbi:MAG: VTT domain-containing protein [Proteobacteria bacterium]|nr:VTT domain-containing protein [Pseudomonadota bacterium]MDA1023167.1 VTT domain-containing protein [Pseudomonadota bacterium]